MRELFLATHETRSYFNWISSAHGFVREMYSISALLAGVVTVEADRAYFTLRASQEILAAETAEHPKAKAVHYQIAEHYLALASSIEAHHRRTRHARHARRREPL